jgi:2-deoxy-D-gluconate 3-dehydrogenase
MTTNALFDLDGTVALVTGGNGGIGRGIALGLASAGADVVIAARDAAKTRAVVAEVEALGRRAVGVACDVLVRADVEAAVEAARAAFGRLDILVSNAGVAGGGPPESLSEATWDRVVDTNLKAVFVCAQLAHALLKAGGRGKVINIGSEYSLFGSPTVLPYAASKGGVVQLTKSLAAAWASDGIQVNAIIPGWITTDMTAGVKRNEAFYRGIIERTPSGRFGEPEELAGAAIFLASHASDFITGQSVVVDGGYSIT